MVSLVHKLLLGFCIVSVFQACNKQADEKTIVNHWMGREMTIPDLDAKINGKDTIYKDIINKKYKILVYIDTIGCLSCRLKLLDWQKYIDQIKTISNDIGFIFVVFSNNYRKFEDLQLKNHFHYPVFYDPKARLNQINDLPEDEKYQVFLLNENNLVEGIGNPIHNPEIRKLYEKIITGKW